MFRTKHAGKMPGVGGGNIPNGFIEDKAPQGDWGDMFKTEEGGQA